MVGGPPCRSDAGAAEGDEGQDSEASGSWDEVRGPCPEGPMVGTGVRCQDGEGDSGQGDAEDTLPTPHRQKQESWGPAEWSGGEEAHSPGLRPKADGHPPAAPRGPAGLTPIWNQAADGKLQASEENHPSYRQLSGFQRPQLLHSVPAPHHLPSSSCCPIQMPPGGRAQSTIVTRRHVSYCNWVSTSSCPNCNSPEEEPERGVKYRNAGKEEAAARHQPNRNAENYGEVTEREARAGNCIWGLGQVHTHALIHTHRLSHSHTLLHTPIHAHTD